MSEVLFILITLYVAYVVYTITEKEKAKPSETKPTPAPSILTPTGPTPITATKTTSSAVEKAKVSASETTVASKPAEKSVSQPVQTKAKEAKTAPISSDELRDPVTGETAKVSNNYRGLKRWLKQALVNEGLLEKIYANNELNEATNAKIKIALEAIKRMPKYHA